MAQQAAGSVPANMPILDGKNWPRWSIQMKTLFTLADLMEIVQEGITPIADDASNPQRTAHKELKKKDCKAMLYIQQCVDNTHFERIAGAATSREAWQILEKSNQGAEQLKSVRLQTFKRQYELLHMESNEKISDYFNRLTMITNAMKSCGETFSAQTIVAKVLRTLSSKFDYVVATIEEAKALKTLRVEELQGSLEAHEQRIVERASERSQERSHDQALQAQTFKKSGKGGYKGKGKFRDQKGNSGKFSQN